MQIHKTWDTYLLLFRSIVCPNNLDMTYFQSKQSGKESWKQHKDFLFWKKHCYFLCFYACRWCFLNMLPRRRISEIIQWCQPRCHCTVTHGILQGLLQLPLVCEAPAGTAEASLNAYRCCAEPSSLVPVTAELFTAGTAFLGPELNFSGLYCWWWCWVCCVVLSHFKPIFICVFCLDKASKKKKAASLRWSPVNAGSITCH